MDSGITPGNQAKSRIPGKFRGPEKSRTSDKIQPLGAFKNVYETKDFMGNIGIQENEGTLMMHVNLEYSELI